MDCSTTMNSCRPTHKKSIPCILGDMLQESLQFVSTLEENHENTTGTVNNSLLQLVHEENQLKTTAYLSKIAKNHANRGQIDVIEMASESSSHYKYLFVYEDRTSRYIVLKALRNNDPKYVAMKLLDVITIIGVPRYLQSGNGRNYTEQVVHELRSLWDGFSIIPTDVLKFATNERNFKSIIKSRLLKNPNKTWLEIMKLIQVIENATFSSTGGKFPYEQLFKRNVFEDFFINTETKIDEYVDEQFKTQFIHHNDGSLSFSDDNNAEEGKICQESIKKNIDNSPSKYPGQRVISSSFNFENVENKELPAMDSILENSKSSPSKSKDNYTFKCNVCPKRYMRLIHLKNHLKSHKLSNNLECSKCSATFLTQFFYDNHTCKLQKKISGDICSQVAGGEIEVITQDQNSSGTKNLITCLKRGLSTTQRSTITLEKVSKSGTPVNLRKKNNVRENRPKVNGSLLECSYCEQKFDFPSVLQRHMRSHTNERPYICKICNKSFKQLGHLTQHSVTHTDYRSLQCNQCGVKFESLNTLKIHFRTHPADSELKKNLHHISANRLFDCDICKKVFTTKSVLERHIFTHTHERHFECEVCGKRFKQSGHVKSHMLVHTGERRFQCTICSKRFSLANSLKKHMYIHNGDKPYQCDVCGARFLEKRNLNGHLMTHTNEKPFGCKLCGKRYTLADTLRRHVSAAHEDGRTYQCEICAKMFKQLAHLSVHKKVHNDERPFQCHLCEKNFKHKNVLKSHLAIHANVRPFECDECKATFVRKTNLQTHISSAHMNERPYTCNICGKKFKQVSHLNGHVIVHSNSMPYQCDFCDRRCNRLDNLKKHMRLHTKNKG